MLKYLQFLWKKTVGSVMTEQASFLKNERITESGAEQ